MGQAGGQQGGDGGGAPESSVGATRGALGVKNLTIGLIWLVMSVGGGMGRRRARGGAGGGGLGDWAREAGREGADRRGHQRAVHFPFPLLGSLKILTTGLIWLATRGGAGGVKSVIPASAVTCPTCQCMMSVCSRF